ncbi:MAG: hypothetical protein OEX12_11560 [Gammaproteobacteria bacterium]|nr:hypothetical protein [Gammaproteobacteria bacterium]
MYDINDETYGKALNKGYTITISPKFGNRFTNGERNIWGRKGSWTTADLIDDTYTNHKRFKNINNALDREFNDGFNDPTTIY